MNEKLSQYLNGVFAPYEGVKSVAELEANLLSDLQERFRELKAIRHQPILNILPAPDTSISYT